MSDIQLLADNIRIMNISENIKNLPSLPLNVWLKVFGYLRRNDMDNCQLVCRRWRSIIYHNAKFLPRREIEYLIVSSARCFTIQICSENKIKVFKFQKYFTAENIWTNINDRSMVSVQTIYKDENNKDAFTYVGNFQDQLTSVIGRNDTQKYRHKISTPPVLFFKILRSLLRDKGEINHLSFRKFTFTDAFLEKAVFYLDLPINVKQLHLSENRRRDGLLKQPSVTYINFINDLIQEERFRRKEPSDSQSLAPAAQVQQQEVARPPQVQAMIAMMRNRIEHLRQFRAHNRNIDPDVIMAMEHRLQRIEQDQIVVANQENLNNEFQPRQAVMQWHQIRPQGHRILQMMDDLEPIHGLEDEVEVFAHFEHFNRGALRAAVIHLDDGEIDGNVAGPANPNQRQQQRVDRGLDDEMVEMMREFMRD